MRRPAQAMLLVALFSVLGATAQGLETPSEPYPVVEPPLDPVKAAYEAAVRATSEDQQPQARRLMSADQGLDPPSEPYPIVEPPLDPVKAEYEASHLDESRRRLLMTDSALPYEFGANHLQANDDGSTLLIPLPAPLNFFTTPYTGLYVNNNGDITFREVLPVFTPFNLYTTNIPIVAPFFGDVDTRGVNSGLCYFDIDADSGVLSKAQQRAPQETPGFMPDHALVATWPKVGYYQQHTDKTNTFQMALTWSDSPTDKRTYACFYYGDIQWETGDASGGSNGFGVKSARIGFSAGDGNATNSYELPGSGVTGSFVNGGPHALKDTSTCFLINGEHIVTVEQDPILTSFQGQQFAFHGAANSVYNLLSHHTAQVNARFVPDANPNAHSGTWMNEAAVVTAAGDKVHVWTEDFERLRATLNGKKLRAGVTPFGVNGAGSVTWDWTNVLIVDTPTFKVNISAARQEIFPEQPLFDQWTPSIDVRVSLRKLPTSEAFPEKPLDGVLGQTYGLAVDSPLAQMDGAALGEYAEQTAAEYLETDIFATASVRSRMGAPAVSHAGGAALLEGGSFAEL
ncbi:hypothetical protein WJX72_007367 [[Myrmecia] bisecta]|uniref:NIDO domain-containing protein n=1 Tax=[Myrmecia] bisecta TaxID=41462 RepID=A0AAW1R816_9CHLO